MADPDFPFENGPDFAVFLCRHIAESGATVRMVSHDGDGAWQFLCGEFHDEDDARIFGLGEVVALDRALAELAELPENHVATRDGPDDAWEISDEGEDFLLGAIEEVGFAIEVVEPGADEDEPGYAYTVGLTRTFGHPELILFDAPDDVATDVLNLLGDRIREGEKFRGGDGDTETLDDRPIRFREVHEVANFEACVPSALEFYDGEPFRLLQILWPDDDGRFPPEADSRQPLL